ncbi:[FeFe] hydrogenase H-cluster radical SAM maturase HydE [Pseudodesulfovibrio thermohalotolerans]|uniref:[FeFe] hydrogenase H-cluster radical SAM maturase HydE n=1 Tax=Pseudodesulfovibrio thermohalotolerans TaxID=2880651 RepID=UPI0024435C33|nr:[FeFe] hydrogenase H-cluster radical SAM maturase HydE [Pseudodesulfovibrio thermohalotolerans]WFS63109.1 [FeFe] hydrogenase H-cluster radical SAM maturase HydE [Pseudodesulfovibrio thermohalotolerans]
MLPHEIVDMLRAPDAGELFKEAAAVRDAVFGREVFQRGVVEFGNQCRKDCLYCGLRKGNGALRRYVLDDDSVVRAAGCVVEAGMGTVVLQSGEEGARAVRRIGRLVREIGRLGDVSVTLCLGDYDEDAYRYWRDCGADRYLLKVETFDEELHRRCRPGQSVHERVERVRLLRRLGYETGSGLITGLPGMTPEILANDILELTALSLDMIAVGPFVPHPDTPLRRAEAGSMEESLRAVALLRILNPLANIPATSALDALAPDGRERGLAAGANVVMPSVTPESVRREYFLYPGKNDSAETVMNALRRLRGRLRKAGYEPSPARGASPAFLK